MPQLGCNKPRQMPHISCRNDNIWDCESHGLSHQNHITVNDVCIVFPAISAVEDGFDVQVVVDAGGSPTSIADETALRRMEKHGVTLTSTNQAIALPPLSPKTAKRR